MSSRWRSVASGELVNSPESNLSDPIEQIGSLERDLIRFAALLEDKVVLQSCCFLCLSLLRKALLDYVWARLRLAISAGSLDFALLNAFRSVLRKAFRLEEKNEADLPLFACVTGQARARL